MNLKNKFRILRKQEGFTLVELIVVIAIIAVLGGVAVPAYSGYIERTNKAADQTLIGEVKHALELYYYGNPDADMSTAWVKLGQEGQRNDAGDAGAAAMLAVFGEGWETAAGLKYADWTGEDSAPAYVNSSYHGNEKSLLNEVDRLTSALGDAVKKYNIGLGTEDSAFSTFLDQYGMSRDSDAHAIGNAATLYVAQQTAGKGDFIKNTFSSNLSSPNFLNDTYTALSPEIGDAAALAAIYAYAEGFAQYCDAKDSNTKAVETFHNAANFDNTTDAAVALNAINTAFNELGAAGQNYVSDYMAPNGPGMADLNGYVGIMGTVNNNKNVVEGNLAADNCFTDGKVESLLNGYATIGSMNVSTQAGEVAVVLGFENGMPKAYASDMELN